MREPGVDCFRATRAVGPELSRCCGDSREASQLEWSVQCGGAGACWASLALVRTRFRV